MNLSNIEHKLRELLSISKEMNSRHQNVLDQQGRIQCNLSGSNFRYDEKKEACDRPYNGDELLPSPSGILNTIDDVIDNIREQFSVSHTLFNESERFINILDDLTCPSDAILDSKPMAKNHLSKN